MIDFKNGAFLKLKETSDNEFANTLIPFFVDGEEIISTYKGLRDGVVFTNKRVIAINVQGMTGSKKDFTSLPYAKIQAFSVETAGFYEKQIAINGDTELELYFSGLGKIKFEFHKNADIIKICKVISNYVL